MVQCPPCFSTLHSGSIDPDQGLPEISQFLLTILQVELYKTCHGAVRERRWATQISLWYEARCWE
jgi:hypothetical protein